MRPQVLPQQFRFLFLPRPLVLGSAARFELQLIFRRAGVSQDGEIISFFPFWSR